MHAQFPRYLDEKLVDNEQLYQWLKSEDNKEETESTTESAQDQATILKIKFWKKKLTVHGGHINNIKKVLTT